MTIYLISGLGADKRAFQKLVFPENMAIKHIEWIPPYNNESLKDYALRLSKKIDTTQPFVLIGLSFGGIIVTELIKIITPVKSIIISSIKNKNEISGYLKILGKLKLHRLLPTRFLNKPNFILYWLFGIQNEQEKFLLSQILRDTNVKFMKWAFNAILYWNQQPNSLSIFHIHGTNDRMLPIKYTKPTIKIDGGGHFMVFTKAKEINQIILEEIGLGIS